MWRPFRNTISVFLIFLAYGILQKCIFVGVYHSLMDVGFASALWGSIRHGFTMDCTVAAYLTALPALIFTAGVWLRSNILTKVFKVYTVIAAILAAIITTVDLGLYSYWGFRLDSTPLFYFATSPSAAMASARWWEIAGGMLLTACLALALWQALRRSVILPETVPNRKRPASTGMMIAAMALLFVAARGSLTVSTMNISHCYYSSDMRLNHAAVNPAFSLLYSLTHQADFGSQYRFMSDENASALMSRLNKADDDTPVDTMTVNLRTQRPDIYLIILESFSAHLMPSLGGDSVAVNLDSLAREGILFSNVYASSFRTDRALPAILSGFPGQPSTSILKFTDKLERLPGLASSLADAGYSSTYYYGGDANFTNMRAYLVSSGFSSIISDKDFALADRTGKWGAHDHLVFNRALDDARKRTSQTPAFTVIQTSSSHEPFEVPYHNPRFTDKPRRNAFAYTDSCLMDFVDGLRSLPNYDKTLIAIVPDHYGAWPQNLTAPSARHHIPFILAGGAIIDGAQTIPTIASQTDIAATLLSLLGLPADAYTFSHDILDPEAPHYAFFSEPSLAAIVSPQGVTTINCDQATAASDSTSSEVQAYLQTIYTTIDKL